MGGERGDAESDRGRVVAEAHWEAAQIGRLLPQQLAAAFGGTTPERAAFSVSG